ncbi:MAG TPA: translation factor GTPase family protein, partial [Rectinemataceae bacterium]|nr:translation factor GTPase family protein [Rectinemataceae bacterium]
MDPQLLPVSEAGEIRNIGVLAHVDAGKTSITERILYLAGLRREAGAVDEGTTATDYLSVERRHGITVKSAAVRFGWKGCTVHLIDTPGHVDFGNEVDRALRILDGAVIALCSVSGVQARTEVIARACAERSLPRLYFINKMDRSGADFFGIVEDLRAGLELNAVALQYPLYEGQKWTGIVDLLQMKALRFVSAESSPGDLLPLSSLSAEAQSKAGSARAFLVEKIAEVDEGILALYAADQEIPAEKLGLALGRATKACKLVPVLCGSAFVDASVKLLLDAVTALLPSPAEAGIPAGIDPRTNMAVNLLPSRDAPLAAFVFKTLSDEAGDVFAWTRIWSGTMRAGKKIFDARSEKDVMVRKI